MKVFPRLAILALLLVFSGAAAAQTPDGEPPSSEDVCDGLTGNAFGLCNSYCEAMDCDSPDRRASERACERKFQKFLNLTGSPPPCAGISCPCQVPDFPIFSSFADGTATITDCAVEDDPDLMIMTIDSGADNATVTIPADPTDDPACSSSDPGLQIPFPITLEQAEECVELLFAAAAEDNVSCQ